MKPVKVFHAVKNREYEYPDDATAKERCEQAVRDSNGRYNYKQLKDGGYAIEAAPQPKEK